MPQSLLRPITGEECTPQSNLHSESHVCTQGAGRVSVIRLVVIVGMLLLPISSYAEDINNLAKLLNMTTHEVNSAKNKQLNSSFFGKGEVGDVRKGSVSGQWEVWIASLDQPIWIQLMTSCLRAPDLKRSQRIRFSGRLRDLFVAHLPNGKPYLRVTLIDGDID